MTSFVIGMKDINMFISIYLVQIILLLIRLICLFVCRANEPVEDMRKRSGRSIFLERVSSSIVFLFASSMRIYFVHYVYMLYIFTNIYKTQIIFIKGEQWNICWKLQHINIFFTSLTLNCLIPECFR